VKRLTCDRCSQKFILSRKGSRKYCFRCIPAGVTHFREYKIKICKYCHKEFSTHPNINGEKHRMYYREFCLKCVPINKEANKHLYNKPNKNFNGVLDNTKLRCKECNKFYLYKRHGYSCSPTKCGRCLNRNTKHQHKKMSVDYLGGRCINCGWDLFVEGLAFHHKNRDIKDFTISSNRTSSWKRLKRELNKCVLLCLVCHAGVHAGHVKLVA
jgi:hypothetical protein